MLCLNIVFHFVVFHVRNNIVILMGAVGVDTTFCDKVCQWFTAGRWFSPCTPVSSTNKTDSHDITEILLKVVLNTINQTSNHLIRMEFSFCKISVGDLVGWKTVRLCKSKCFKNEPWVIRDYGDFVVSWPTWDDWRVIEVWSTTGYRRSWSCINGSLSKYTHFFLFTFWWHQIFSFPFCSSLLVFPTLQWHIHIIYSRENHHEKKIFLDM